MKFFMDRYGDEYPVSEITRIVRATGERGDKPPYTTRYQMVHLRDGERVEVSEWTVKEITSAPALIVPAAPGTFLLGNVDIVDTSVTDVFQTPVIAFAIGEENAVTPWTPDGPNDGVTNPGPLLMPNGMVIEVGNCCYRSIDEWFAEQRAELTRRKDAASSAAPGAAD